MRDSAAAASHPERAALVGRRDIRLQPRPAPSALANAGGDGADTGSGQRPAASVSWGWESERDVEVAGEILRETELDEFEARLMNEMSGGERQRAVLARALATEAKVFLLDEPTANLDLAHQATMLRLVRSRCDDRESAAVVVTHDVNLAAEFADRVMLLKDGQMIAIGSSREVLTPELLRRVFDLQVLVDAHPITGAPRITPVHGVIPSPSGRGLG